MGNFCRLVGVFIVLFLLQDRLAAQESPSSQLLSKASADHLQFLRDNAAIYNGAEYVGYGQQINGHPFFGDDNLKRGDLLYLGVWYKNIPLYYDMVSDVILIQSFDGNHYLRLGSSKVSAFTYGSDQFVKIPGEAVGKLQRSFIQLLHAGKVAVYAQKKKVLVTSSSSEKSTSSFQQFNDYFILYGGKWTEINKSSDLVSLFRDYKEPLKRWLSAQPYRYKKNPEWTLVQAAAFIETLIK